MGINCHYDFCCVILDKLNIGFSELRVFFTESISPSSPSRIKGKQTNTPISGEAYY